MQSRIIYATLFSALALTGCQQKKPEKAVPVYEKMTVSLSSVTLETDYAATMTGREIVEVRPQVSGLITRILIQEGDKVRRGQVLFQIDPAPYQAAVDEAVANAEAAEAKLNTARLNAESRQSLFDQHVIGSYEKMTAQNALSEAKAALAQARAKEKTARTNLGYTTVRSPLDGVAGMIPYHVGALVSSSISQPLVTVSDDDEMLVYFSLSERECTDMIQQYGSIDAFLGQMPQVKLRLSNGTEYHETGRVDAVSGIAEQGTVSLRARFPNPGRLLRSGSSATVVLQTPRDSVIVIPQTATYELQNRVFAYRVADGKAQTAPLEVFRLNNGQEYVVESGLKPGDVIIARGAGLLREGERVE
ncbi:MAG: efflux RND transporter periplasmic adaptor subunit [Bacteroidaceae bacterium]|nr:efflux RND transporter periplasmic adaptor subunit [Bacteroidaceae bacterium]